MDIEIVKMNIAVFQEKLLNQIKDFEIQNGITVQSVQSITLESKFEPGEFNLIGVKLKIEL